MAKKKAEKYIDQPRLKEIIAYESDFKRRYQTTTSKMVAEIGKVLSNQ